MLRNWLKSPLVSSLTVLAVTAGGVAVTAPAASAAPRAHAAHSAHSAHHRDATERQCDAAGRAVKKARKAAKAAAGQRAVRAKSALAKALAAEASICLDAAAIDELLAMLPEDVAAQVEQLIDDIVTVLGAVEEDIPGANGAELDSIIKKLTAMDADTIVGLLTDLLAQLQATGGDPEAVATVLATVVGGMGEDPTDPGTIDPDDELDTKGDLPSLATVLQNLLHYLTTTDLSDLMQQWKNHMQQMKEEFQAVLDELVEAHPELEVLVDLFVELGFDGVKDSADEEDVAAGFGGILSALLGHTGHGQHAVDHGIGGLLDGGGLFSVLNQVFGGGQNSLWTGLSGLFSSIFGGLGSGGLFGAFFGGLFGAPAKG